MVGTVDIGGRDISAEAFDVRILMDSGSGFTPPDSFGQAHMVLYRLLSGGCPSVQVLSI